MNDNSVTQRLQNNIHFRTEDIAKLIQREKYYYILVIQKKGIKNWGIQQRQMMRQKIFYTILRFSELD